MAFKKAFSIVYNHIDGLKRGYFNDYQSSNPKEKNLQLDGAIDALDKLKDKLKQRAL